MARNKRKKRGDLIGIAIIFLSLVVVIGFGLSISNYMDNQVKIDKQTFCPTEEPLNKTVVLIDLSDELNKPQKEFFLKEMESIKNDVKKHHNFTIYLLDEDLNISENKKISICNPGTQKDIENSNIIEKSSINPRKVKEDWEKLFSERISNEIDQLLERSPSQNTSPVLEMIQLVSIREFKNLESDANNLIIVSDMLQNTNNFSMYKSAIPSFDEFRKEEYFSKIRTDLKKNVKIKLFILKRDGYRKTQESEKFLEFWSNFFYRGNKADDLNIVFIDG